MNIIKNIYYFYLNGFRNMTLGKTLWKIIFVKILIIMYFLNCFIHDKSLEKDGIFYHGPLYGMQKKDFLKALDIFVLPSFYASEAMPISIIEAMRSGCVIIATEHHYLPFLVGPD